MSNPGLTMDAITVERWTSAMPLEAGYGGYGPYGAIDTDAEGTDTGTYAVIYDGYGTYGTVSANERLTAAQAGQQIDAVVATTFADARPGDRVIVRGHTYDVVSVADVRLHWRIFLRRVDI